MKWSSSTCMKMRKRNAKEEKDGLDRIGLDEFHELNFSSAETRVQRGVFTATVGCYHCRF